MTKAETKTLMAKLHSCTFGTDPSDKVRELEWAIVIYFFPAFVVVAVVRVAHCLMSL